MDKYFHFFFKLSWLENVFENTPSWAIPGTYIQKNPYKLIHFYTLNQYWINALFLDLSERVLFPGGKQYNIGPIWVKKLSDVINPF